MRKQDMIAGLSPRDAAASAYRAYAAVTGGKNHIGEDMPLFDQLPKKIQSAWVAATQHIHRLEQSITVMSATHLEAAEQRWKGYEAD